MPGTKPVPNSRGRYVSAGYSKERNHLDPKEREEKELYIAEIPAGSAQESLRDLNLPGYRCERPWRDSPTPIFETAKKEPPKAQTAEKKAAPKSMKGRRIAARPKRPEGFVERLIWEAEHDKKGVLICAVLIVTMLMMSAAWGRQMVSGVETQQSIDAYRANTMAFEQENEKLTQELELAKDGGRIRNLAQNELGMLRPERAETKKIYIRMPDRPAEETAQETGGTKMETLDFLLGLLSVFHIGE